MTSRIGVVPRHFIAAAFALCLFATYATAQVAIQPKAEVFGGYSWLGISGTADFGVKVPDISTGFDASTTYYLPQAHNLGLIADGSGHFDRDLRTVAADVDPVERPHRAFGLAGTGAEG